MVKLEAKQEQFVQAIPHSDTVTKAYQDTYKCSYNSAKASSSQLLAKPNVRARMMEILEGNDAGLSRVGAKLKEHLENTKPMVSLESAKTILRVAGAFDEDTERDRPQDIQVNIAIVTKDGQTTLSI